jgi:hypothetical protein
MRLGAAQAVLPLDGVAPWLLRMAATTADPPNG